MSRFEGKPPAPSIAPWPPPTGGASPANERRRERQAARARARLRTVPLGPALTLYFEMPAGSATRRRSPEGAGGPAHASQAVPADAPAAGWVATVRRRAATMGGATTPPDIVARLYLAPAGQLRLHARPLQPAAPMYTGLQLDLTVMFPVHGDLVAALKEGVVDSLWLGCEHDQYAYRRLIPPALFAALRDELAWSAGGTV